MEAHPNILTASSPDLKAMELNKSDICCTEPASRILRCYEGCSPEITLKNTASFPFQSLPFQIANPHLVPHSKADDFACPRVSGKHFAKFLGSVRVWTTRKTWSQISVTSRAHLQILKNCHFTVNLKDFWCYSFFSLVDFSDMIKFTPFTEFSMIFGILY